MGFHLGGLMSAVQGAAATVANLVGQAVSALSFTSTQASGSDAFAATTNGARWHFGAGASDYASSDGTTITFAGPVTVTGSLRQVAGQTLAIDAVNPTLAGFQTTAASGIIRVIAGSAMSPNGDGLSNLGSASARWADIFCFTATTSLGTGTARGKVGGTANLDTTPVSSATAGPNDLITYALPANSLTANGRGIRITAWGTATNNANAKTVTLNFGGTALVTTALTANQAGTWRITAEVVRTGAATQIASAQLIQGGTTTLVDVETSAPGETLTGAVTVKCTATNEITQLGLFVESI